MSHSRFVTRQEADLITNATEAWLRLREIEFNPGEFAAALSAGSVLREDHCDRRDITDLGRTILLAVPREPLSVALKLVHTGCEEPRKSRISMLSELGLARIGQVLGSALRTPYGGAKLVVIAEDDAERSYEAEDASA